MIITAIASSYISAYEYTVLSTLHILTLFLPQTHGRETIIIPIFATKVDYVTYPGS